MTAASKPTCPEETASDAGNLELTNNQILVACILLLPRDAAPILALLKHQTRTLARPTLRNRLAFTPYPFLRHRAING